MSRLSNLPEDISIIIWKKVFQESLDKLRCHGIEHLKICGICKKHLLKYEDLIPITEEYDILKESYMNERSYHCKCQFQISDRSNIQNRYCCCLCKPRGFHPRWHSSKAHW